MSATLALKAKQIISEILYITIATVDSYGQPWNTPVYAAYDEGFNFYWASWTESTHSRNIRENPKVCLVIYDSTVPEGTGKGVYMTATAHELTEPNAVAQALEYYYGRVAKPPPQAPVFLDNSPRRIYKATPQQFWLNDYRLIKDMQVDTRVEVYLR
ncbi:MAG: pyridoxamine 5'-phosphate oxidase family protein [Egibacteraceae bacterium]